jgi:hypothetical protein
MLALIEFKDLNLDSKCDFELYYVSIKRVVNDQLFGRLYNQYKAGPV